MKLTSHHLSWLSTCLCNIDEINADVLAAGEALGHAGEWEGLRDYLKSSYRASELGQVRWLCFQHVFKISIHSSCMGRMKVHLKIIFLESLDWSLRSCGYIVTLAGSDLGCRHNARLHPLRLSRRSPGHL